MTSFVDVFRVRWLALLVAMLASGPLCAADGDFRIVAGDQGIAIHDGERPVLFYQQAMKSRDGRFGRANYVHPLYDLDGRVISEDFPADHLHHRGIFWAWHQVRVGDKPLGDAWTCRRFEWKVTSSGAAVEDGKAVIRSRVEWRSPDWTVDGRQPALVEEQVRIEIGKATAGYRLVDFRIRLRALRDEVWIGGSDDVKGYGGFSARVRMPKDIKFAGPGGPVAPLATAVKAGPWINVTGKINGQQRGGIAIFQHRSLPAYPQPWILRSSGSMQNAAYPGRQPIRLDPGKPLLLAYRLVIHRGDLSSSQLADLHKLYCR